MIRKLAGLALLTISSAAFAQTTIASVDLARPERPTPGPHEAMVVMRFHAPGMVGDNRVLFAPWDRGSGNLHHGNDRPRFRANYSYTIFGGRRGEVELRVVIVPAGDYVLAARVFNGSHTDSFCLGAPVFTVAPGAVTYLGDFEMFGLALMPDRERRNAMRYSARLEEARGALAAHYPAQAASLAPWQPTNGNRFSCEGTEFTAYAVPGAQR